MPSLLSHGPVDIRPAMHSSWRRCAVIGVVVGVTLGLAHEPAQGQDTAPTTCEEQLQRTLEELRQQIADLQRAVDVLDAEPAAATPEPPPDPNTLRVYWREGIRMESSDRSLQFQIGGRIMNDWTFPFDDPVLESRLGDFRSGTEFRRARLFVSGVLRGRVDFKAQYDFAGGGANFKDVYVGLRQLPGVRNLRVGHFKEGFSLEEMTSSKYITFMERSLINVFAPSRNTGIAVLRDHLDERLTWHVGAFQPSNSFGDGEGPAGLLRTGGYGVTGRLTGLPWRTDDGARLLHLGVAASYREPPDRFQRFRQRPGNHLLPRFIDTGSFEADTVVLLGAEVALVDGPFSFQSEAARAAVNRPTSSDATFWGWYVQASYFLTGEHRRYDGGEGAFGRVRPRSDLLGGPRSPGAWEIAIRYAQLDLEDADITADRLDNLTAGVNWYLNPNTRVMWNVIRPKLESVGDMTAFQMRMQVDF